MVSAIGETMIAQRRADLNRYQKLTPPLIVTSDGEVPAVRYRGPRPGFCRAIHQRLGVVEGMVQLIRNHSVRRSPRMRNPGS